LLVCLCVLLLSVDSFIAQLAKDEVEVQKANLFTHVCMVTHTVY